MVDYFDDIGEDAIHDIIYNLQGQKYLKGEILQDAGDNAVNLFLLQDGVIEIVINSDGTEFVVEKLFRGSIINYRNFFLEEKGEVQYRFGRNSICYLMSIHKLMEILPRHKELRRKYFTFK